MNILPKKKWHVRTKENVARVRRDQKRAAEEEKRIKERAEKAEQEFKVSILRRNADERMERLYGRSDTKDEKEVQNMQISGPSGHLNFFADLEAEDRKNLGTGNKEYEQEKRKEQEEYEKKVGILQYLGQGSNELTKEKPWYEKISRRKTEEYSSKKPTESAVISTSVAQMRSSENATEKRKKRRKKHDREGSKHSKKKKKRKRRRSSSSESSSDAVQTAAKNEKLEKLRQERLLREAKERKRLAELMNPKTEANVENKSIQKYNSQFNPDFAKQNRLRPTLL